MNGLENWRRESCSGGQCSCTQVCGWNSCCAWLWLWTGWSPSIFSIFGTIWLFSVPQREKTLDQEAVSDRWWGHICSWGLVWESGWELYHGNPSAATYTLCKYEQILFALLCVGTGGGEWLPKWGVNQGEHSTQEGIRKDPITRNQGEPARGEIFVYYLLVIDTLEYNENLWKKCRKL